jgi:hypothetical protein
MAAISESGTGTVLEVAEVVLPYLPDTAKKWRRSADAVHLKLPGFSLNSSGTATKLQDTLRDAYLILLWQYEQRGMQYCQYRTCTDYWSAWRHYNRDFWYLFCHDLDPIDAYPHAVKYAKANIKSLADLQAKGGADYPLLKKMN